MPQTIGELINNLALKAGIASDDADLKSLLTSAELATVTVSDDLVSSIDKGLLSIDAAKNNHPDIKKKYFADAYDGMDKQLMALVANDTFDQADIDEIKAEKSTSKKAELIVSKLKAAKASAKGADKEAINQQLLVAHEAARKANEEKENLKNEYEGKIKSIHKQAALKTSLASYKTIYDELPTNIRLATMEALINNALQDKNAELTTDEHGNLQLVAKDGSNVFGSNHVLLTPQSFLDQSLAPILKVSGTSQQQQQKQTPVIAITKDNDKADVVFDSIKSHNEQVLATLGTPKASLM